MSGKKREEELRKLLSEVCKSDVSGIKLEDDLVHELGLDSLAGLAMLAAVEKRFELRLPDDLLDEIRTMQQLLEIIDGKDGGQRS